MDGAIYSVSVCDDAAWVAPRTGADVKLLPVLGRREAAGPINRSCWSAGVRHHTYQT